MKLKRLILLASAFCMFLVGYGVIAHAYPSPWPYGRDHHRGYFNNLYDDQGKYVLAASCSGTYYYNNGQDWCNAIPSDVDTAAEFTSFIENRLDYGSSTDQVGAAFIIQTMSGSGYGWPDATSRAKFRNLVNSVGPYSLWNTGSFSFNLNSYNQKGNDGVGPNDIALYDNSGSNHQSIVFRDVYGNILYVIKRRCANPVGYNGLNPIPDYVMQGTTTLDNPAPFPGDTITFNHSLQNVGTSSSVYIWWIVDDTSDPANIIRINGGNSYGYTAGQTKTVLANDQVTVPAGTPAGTRICRRVGWDPTSPGVTLSYAPEKCAIVQGNFNLSPSVNAVITSGGAPITGSFAEPGDTVTFTYSVTNSTPSSSYNTSCSIYGQTKAGYQPPPTPNDSSSTGGYSPPATICPYSFPGNGASTTIATESNVPLSTINQSICRSLFVNPGTPGGGPVGTQVCVYVAGKPYARSYGGDIFAGGDFETTPGTCANNTNAAVVGWNKGTTSNFAGAGAQYAIYALNRINYVSTTLGNGGGGAGRPTGLAFSNTVTDALNGWYGGNFGALPCITNYYAGLPSSPLSIPATVSAMGSGDYAGSGQITLGGGSIINPNNRISLYIDGDLYITSNISYAGSWNVNSMPMFRIIVRGNIFIDTNVSRLDGLYIAQKNLAGNGGTIYTCATSTSTFTPLPLSGTTFSDCDNTKLTVNGSFVAYRIQLLRTLGTLAQSTDTESGAAGFAAEVFNYGPAMWIPQPIAATPGQVPDYDAIVSLPPVL